MFLSLASALAQESRGKGVRIGSIEVATRHSTLCIRGRVCITYIGF